MIAEANGRTSLFINTVAADLVATAFAGQAATWGPPLWGFTLVVLPVVVSLGGGFVLIAWRSLGLIAERTRLGPATLEGYGEMTALYAFPGLAHWVLAAVDRPGTAW